MSKLYVVLDEKPIIKITCPECGYEDLMRVPDAVYSAIKPVTAEMLNKALEDWRVYYATSFENQLTEGEYIIKKLEEMK